MKKIVIAGAWLGVAALGVMQLPLAGFLGYEWVTAMTLPITLVVGLLTIYDNRSPSSWRLVGRAVGLLVLPLLLIVVNTWRLGSCGWGNAITLFLAIPVVSAIFAAAVAELCRTHTASLKRASGLYGALVILSLGFTLARLILGTSLQARNPFFGFFPGPIYDAAIIADLPLALYRLWVILLAVFWLLLSKIDWQNLGAQRLRVTGLAVTGLLVLGGFAWESDFGFYTSRAKLRQILGGVHQQGVVTIYYDRRLAEQNTFRIEEFADDALYWIKVIADELQVVPQPLTIYLYADVASKKRLTGTGWTYIGNPLHREVHLLPPQNFPDLVLKHELTHVVAGEFGLPILHLGRTPALMEGLAVALEQTQGNFLIDAWAAAIFSSPYPPKKVEAWLAGWEFLGAAPQKAYPLAGSFVAFVMRQYGMSTVKQLYRHGDFRAATGQELSTLIAEWRDSLKNIEITETMRAQMFPVINRPSLFAQRCPHESAFWRDQGYAHFADGDHAAAEGCWQRSLELSRGSTKDWEALLRLRSFLAPADPLIESYLKPLIERGSSQSLVAWAQARQALANKQWSAAQGYLQQLLKWQPTLEAFVTLTWLTQGQVERAAAFYNATMEERRKIWATVNDPGDSLARQVWEWRHPPTNLELEVRRAVTNLTAAEQQNVLKWLRALPPELATSLLLRWVEQAYRQNNLPQAQRWLMGSGDLIEARLEPWRQRLGGKS